jgi:NAD(P)-dependent dehydrogenase (short-subunit alcohol dehydrogenase family)
LYGTIIFAGRDPQKHERAIAKLRKNLGKGDSEVELKHMDLELDSLQSVRDFAAAFIALGISLHTLILNAGVMAIPDRRLTADGFEYQFGVNHLGHFLLANLLLDSLVSSGSWSDPGRLISLSSSAHQIPSPLLRGDLTDLGSERYAAWSAYGQSKLANLLFVYELDRRCRKLGVPLAVNAVHPGVVSTELARYMMSDGPAEVGSFLQELVKPFTSLTLKTPKDGAATSVLLATKEEGTLSGRYWQDERPAASMDLDLTGGLPAPTRALLPFGGPPRLTSYDTEAWEELWRESAALVGLSPEGGSKALSGPQA